jgi:hypothetical protein
LLLFLLWTATDHKAAASNMNLLWALPTHLIVVAGLIREKKWTITYFKGTAILSGLLLITWSWLPQILHFSLVPIMIIVIMRAYTNFYLSNTRS